MIGWLGFLRGGCCLGLLAVYGYGSPSVYAAEICTDRDEFIHFAQQHKLLKQQVKVQDESIKALVEKDKAWQKYKESAEPLLAEYASRLEESIKREEALTARNDYLEAKVAEQGNISWVSIAEVAGGAIAGVATARWGGKYLWRIGKRMMGR